jgi:hypothetical protein
MPGVPVCWLILLHPLDWKRREAGIETFPIGDVSEAPRQPIGLDPSNRSRHAGRAVGGLYDPHCLQHPVGAAARPLACSSPKAGQRAYS